MLHAVFAYGVTILLMKTATPALGHINLMLPVLGGLPTGMTQPGAVELAMRSITWAAAIPIGLALVGTSAAVLVGGFKWAGFHQRR
jgi:hypothetical protein